MAVILVDPILGMSRKKFFTAVHLRKDERFYFTRISKVKHTHADPASPSSRDKHGIRRQVAHWMKVTFHTIAQNGSILTGLKSIKRMHFDIVTFDY